jgi:dihydrofolate reductase
MSLSLIAAVSKNGVIGRNNDLPWKLPDDMKYFKEMTKGHAVIMGRRNYESVPEKYKPLPYRVNIIVTRQKDFVAPGCQVVNSIEEAVKVGEASNKGEIFDIGGSEIFRLGMPLAKRIYLTEIKAEIEGDVYFPEFDRKQWKEVSRTAHGTDERHAFAFDFVVYERLR